jgi:hypothetical protein
MFVATVIDDHFFFGQFDTVFEPSDLCPRLRMNLTDDLSFVIFAKSKIEAVKILDSKFLT